MGDKFEGNLIMCLPFMAVFLQVCEKKKKKTKQMSNFLKVHTFRPGMCSLPICWHLHSEFGLVWTRDHGPTNWRLLRVFPQLKIARYCTPGGAFELPHKSGIYLL